MALARSDLWSLEEYSEHRDVFRTQVIAHKKHRKIFLGPHATLYFEDALTMKYQIQEMLRVEKIFSRTEIEEELEAYNPLIPDGSNWKATFMLEYPDIEERRLALATLGGIEHRVWVKVGSEERSFAIANEDMERSNDSGKASAVHFMRFELSDAAIAAAKAGAPIQMGIDHPVLPYEITLSAESAASLSTDFA